MTAYLCISVGTDPETALPILATTDPDVVDGAVRAIVGKVKGGRRDVIARLRADAPSPTIPLAHES